MKSISRVALDAMDKRVRIQLATSLPGVKPVVLVGTRDAGGGANLAPFSSVVHLGSSPTLLGIITRPWDRVKRSKEGDIFGFFDADTFEPDQWKGGYPNPAFGRMTERDAAWATRIIARFTPELVAEAVRVGDYTSPVHTEFLTKALLARQRKILRRYFAKLSPITDLTVTASGELCGVDLGRKTAVFADQTYAYRAALFTGESLTPGPAPAVRKVLALTGLTLAQMDVIELNEAFAAQGLAVLRDLGLADDDARVNPNGGAIALGHPLGASGARLVTTAVQQLHASGGRYGLCTMCIGVGQGIALVVERV
jgi:hypothetical protein